MTYIVAIHCTLVGSGSVGGGGGEGGRATRRGGLGGGGGGVGSSTFNLHCPKNIPSLRLQTTPVMQSRYNGIIVLFPGMIYTRKIGEN